MFVVCTRIGRRVLENAGRMQHCRNVWKLFKNDFGTYNVIKTPGNVGACGIIPHSIQTPEYYPHGRPNPSPVSPELKTPEQIEGVRSAGFIARQIMDVIGKNIQAGITTEEIDRIGHSAIIERNCYPSPLHYRGFPKSLCTSVNNVACHGIPDDRKLQPGDIISVDITVYHRGYHGDCCETWFVDGTDVAGQRLVECARAARDLAISVCGPGVPIARIGEVCQEVSHAAGLTIVPVFIGHGIGSYFHGPPDVYHFANTSTEIMKAGMTFTVEPIVGQGSEQVVILKDGWTAMTTDDSRTAQFEHTVLITEDGHDILTEYTDDSILSPPAQSQ
uniref:Methionine aminopeptidase n=2 Tax=Hirondellea gigas TaxID=1518452 RepID=A0A2P2IDV4_9CRUS